MERRNFLPSCRNKLAENVGADFVIHPQGNFCGKAAVQGGNGNAGNAEKHIERHRSRRNFSSKDFVDKVLCHKACGEGKPGGGKPDENVEGNQPLIFCGVGVEPLCFVPHFAKGAAFIFLDYFL